MAISILLIGPELNNNKGVYGAGVGGYTRNFKLYLDHFKFNNYKLIPFYATVRKIGQYNFIAFPLRFFSDISRYIYFIIKYDIKIIHILAQYRGALPREVAWVVFARIFRKKIIYEIKAGQFINEYQSSNYKKFLKNIILKHSDKILCEGKVYVDFINSILSKDRTTYFPNCVSASEIPIERNNFTLSYPLKFLFVGYCYPGKGIIELINALNNYKNCAIELNIIGSESKEFKDYIEEVNIRNGLEIKLFGKKNHEFVLKKMKECIFYVYPSRHKGEGHNNTINEAMMNSMIIITTKIGFLEDILNDGAYFIDSVNEKSISNVINDILDNYDEAVIKAKKNRERVIKIYNSNVLKHKLELIYTEVA